MKRLATELAEIDAKKQIHAANIAENDVKERAKTMSDNSFKGRKSFLAHMLHKATNDGIRAENDGKERAESLRTIWPKTTFAETNDSSSQLKHVLGEMHEVVLALFDASKSGEMMKGTFQTLIMHELADVQHSIETLWRVIDREKGEGFVEKNILSLVETKNRNRGYYVDSCNLEEK